MYKKGTAEVTEEKLVAWYRLSPSAACGNGATSGNTASQLQIEFPPDEIAQDRVFFSAVLASFSGIVVSIGKSAKTAAWSVVPDDDVGVYHGSVAFDGRTGPVTVSLLRDNQVIATMDGESISTSCPHGITNWNAWVGEATTGQAVSARPVLSLAEQVCMSGTGANNFAGLCEFACHYGYCPLGACTCTKMGIGWEPPNSTGVQGYPIAGEDASYSGLCAFNCNLGSCPPSACGTVEVPLTTPTVSPFLPPACVAGTGEGNLAGLCDFSCAHGFCPLNACTCTAQGALNVMDPTTDTRGEAAPGLDASIYTPLCEFTCQRGYCPEGACSPVSDTTPGSGDHDVYIAPSIWDAPSPVVQCQPPCSLIMPPRPLETPSTLSIPPWTTPVEQSYLTVRTSTDEEGGTTTYHGYHIATTTITVHFPTTVLTAIPVWGVSINASQTRPSVVEMTSSISLPHMVYVLPPLESAPTPTTTTTTITPPPYPWTQTTRDTALNTQQTTWSPGDPKPTAHKGDPGTGTRCEPFCLGPCLLCPPDWGNLLGGGGGGGGGGSGGLDPNEGENDECSTRTAQVCTEVCVAGADCGFSCSTTTGCSATGSSTTVVGTPPPGVSITMEQWPEQTDDPADAITSTAVSLESALSSRFGTLTVVSGLAGTAPGPQPTQTEYPNSVLIYRYHEEKTNLDQSRSEAYGFYGAYYAYHHQITHDEVCDRTRAVTDLVDADKSTLYPPNLGSFTLGHYTGCKYNTDGTKPGSISCENNELPFVCLGYMLEGADLTNYACADSLSNSGTKTVTGFQVAAECLVY